MFGMDLIKKMKTLLTFVDSGIVISDTNFQIVYVNPSALKFFNKDIEDMVGVPIVSLFSKDNWENISESINKVKDTNTPLRINIEEKNRFLKLGVSQIMVGEKYIGFILNMLDITVEEHLLIQRAELTSMIINELKDPIYTLYDQFHNKQILTDMKGFESVKDATKMLMQALDTLLDINELTSGILNLELEDVDVLMVMKSSISTIESFAKKQGTRVYSTYNCNNSTVKLDREKFIKGMVNLLSYAIKESGERGVLNIEIRNTNINQINQILILVSNTGTGVAESIFENITDNYSFSHLKDEEKLYLEVLTAKRIIQAHSGSMQAVSEFGIGSSFVITLPAVA